MMTPHRRLLLVLLLVTVATPVSAGPILSTLDVIYAPYLDGLVVEFQSLEPFYVTGFSAPEALPLPTVDNPFGLGAVVFADGRYTFMYTLPGRRCGREQIDGWLVGASTPAVAHVFTTSTDCAPPPCVIGCEPPPMQAVPEPATLGLVGVGLAIAARRRRGSTR